MARQVRTDGFPATSQVSGAKDDIARHIQHIGVVGRKQDRIGPGKAVLHGLGAVSRVDLWPHRDDADLTRAVIIVQQVAAATWGAADSARDDDIGVVGMHSDVATFRGANDIAVAPGDGALLGARRHADGGIVLLRAVEAIRELVVGGDVIELCRELVVDGRPGVAAVVRDTGAAVVALDHALRVARVDPQVMIVAMRRGHLRKCFAAVDGFPALVVEDPYRVGVLRVGKDVLVVPRTALQVAFITDQFPGGATIVGAVQATVLSLDGGPYAPRFGRRHGDAHAAFEAFG